MDRIELTSDLASKITLDNIEHQEVSFLEGYLITEIHVPSFFIGKSIKDLGIRVNYGVDVLSIKNHSKTGRTITAIPQANYVIKKNDTLIVAGETEKINILKNLT